MNAVMDITRSQSIWIKLNPIKPPTPTAPQMGWFEFLSSCKQHFPLKLPFEFCWFLKMYFLKLHHCGEQSRVCQPRGPADPGHYGETVQSVGFWKSERVRPSVESQNREEDQYLWNSCNSSAEVEKAIIANCLVCRSQMGLHGIQVTQSCQALTH